LPKNPAGRVFGRCRRRVRTIVWYDREPLASMNISDLRFPRQLEADGSDEIIRRTLMAETVKLWPGSGFEVPRIVMSDALKKVLRKAMLKAQIRCGLEGIAGKLEKERIGIDNVRGRGDEPYGDRVSRLLLLSNDGAERFYRQIEQLLTLHYPRVLGCFLDVDSSILGQVITGKESVIKCVMAEHKDAVSAILRTVAADTGSLGVHGD
jgi:hypothetical protein